MIPNDIEILENGKPWEGTGGFPGAAQAAAAQKGAAPKPAAHVSPAAATPAAAPSGDVGDAALAGLTDVLEKESDGTTKLKLRTGTFKAVTAKFDQATAQKVIDTYFASDEALNERLGHLGYVVQGTKIVPQ
jgi:hypothetical protein